MKCISVIQTVTFTHKIEINTEAKIKINTEAKIKINTEAKIKINTEAKIKINTEAMKHDAWVLTFNFVITW